MKAKNKMPKLPGSFGDLRFNDSSQLILARMAIPFLHIETETDPIWSKDLSEFGYLMFLNMMVFNDEIFVSGKAHDANASVIIGENFETIIPFSIGNFPCHLAIVNNQVVCYVILNATQYGMFDISGNLLETFQIPSQYHGTSQGIRFVGDDGKVFFGDETIRGEFDGLILSEWIQRRGVTAGQSNVGGVGIIGEEAKFISNLGTFAFFPKLDVFEDKIAVLSVDNTNHINYEIYSPPYPNQPELEIRIPRVRAFERPMWMAPYFSHHTRYGDTSPDKHVGNAIAIDWADENPSRLVGLGLPLIVDIDLPNPASISLNLTVAWLAQSGTLNKLISKVDFALLFPEKPIIAYLDGDNWSFDDPFGSNRVWPSIQAYRFPNESLLQFEMRVLSVINRVDTYNQPMCLVTRFDDFNGLSTIERTLECMPLYEEWLRNYNFVAHMPFADRRGNGIARNEDLWNWARAFQYAIPFERPNRFDYWRPPGLAIHDILENKFGQTRASIVLEPYLRADIMSKYTNSDPILEPEPEPDEWPNLLPTLESVRSKYPELINVDQSVAIINEVAWIHRNQGFGLLRKESGNHGLQPKTGIQCSVDWVVNDKFSRGLDCLADAPNRDAGNSDVATPKWNDGEPWSEFDRFVEPVEPI